MNCRVLNYRVLNADTVSDLEDLVSKLMLKGWRLQGGINVVSLNGTLEKDIFKQWC